MRQALMGYTSVTHIYRPVNVRRMLDALWLLCRNEEGEE
ncbi:protein of unknown function [Methylococcus capsulatus]|uniref:Uncharacterized protein n=1 Tax=Methylococcus capsulatus TaxID=414 RepID=A0AA35V2G9_METCP|nr:protein of unknown function [Methylococcus capsulatus]